MHEPKGWVRKLVRIALGVAAFLLIAWGSYFAWEWRETVKLERFEVVGAQYAPTGEVISLARVDTGEVLFDVDPQIVQDRVRRHPWVLQASASRIPTGTLRLRITEREPAAMVLSSAGEPAYYLDLSGQVLPLADSAAFDVPLISGLGETVRAGQVVESKSVSELVRTLAQLPPQTQALISEIEVLPSGSLQLYTTPAPGRGSIPVRLGRSGYSEKLERLQAFWMKAVLPQQNKTFAWIDLRFNGQIVADEDSLRQ